MAGKAMKKLEIALRVERMYEAMAGTLTNKRMEELKQEKQKELQKNREGELVNFKWGPGEKRRWTARIFKVAKEEVERWIGEKMVFEMLSKKGMEKRNSKS